MAAITNTHEKFLHELGDIYDAEHQFLKGQQEMLKKASDAKLQQLIENHIGQTEQHIKNLEEVFTLLGEKAKREACPAAKGLVTEAQQTMKEAEVDAIRDCLIGGSAAKVEHYEIASYHGLIEGATAMGQPQAVKLFQANLRQEEAALKLIEQSAPQLLEQAMQVESVTGV